MTRTQGNSTASGKETTATGKHATPKKQKRGVMLGLVVALLAGSAAAGIVVVRTRSHAQPAPPPVVETVLHLDTFVVNLSDDDRTYLRVGVDLAVVQPAAKKGTKESAEEPANTAEIRDTILGVLTVAKSTDLMTAEGKGQIKEALRNALNVRIPELKVRDVYFTEFLIQR